MALFLAIVAFSVTLVVPFLLLTNLNGIGIIPSCRAIIFLVPLFLKILPLFILRELFPGSVDLEQGRVGALPSACFASLGLDFLVRGSLAIVPWVCIFEEVLWDGRWPPKQWVSDSRTMVLDLRPALASALTAFYTISWKFMDSQSYCSISNLIEGLRYSRK